AARPADSESAGALKRAGPPTALAGPADEPARLATWHIPLAHPLESWDDARDVAGTASVVQPLILPLFGGKGANELLALLATGKSLPSAELVRETWRSILGEPDFDRRFNRVLHDGLLAGSERPGIAPAVGTQPIAELARAGAAGEGGGVDVVFRPSLYLHDGRFANNGWLQELPDPITKITWDNPALLSPATAAKLGVGNEDLVRVSLGGRSITLPA